MSIYRSRGAWRLLVHPRVTPHACRRIVHHQADFSDTIFTDLSEVTYIGRDPILFGAAIRSTMSSSALQSTVSVINTESS
jgi:hypothetical protein